MRTRPGTPMNPALLPAIRRCDSCGCVLSRSNQGTLCRPCMRQAHAHVEIDPIWLVLLENADDHSIETVADVIAGRKPIGEEW